LQTAVIYGGNISNRLKNVLHPVRAQAVWGLVHTGGPAIRDHAVCRWHWLFVSELINKLNC